jgi:hypothetical protein
VTASFLFIYKILSGRHLKGCSVGSVFKPKTNTQGFYILYGTELNSAAIASVIYITKMFGSV